MTISRNLKAFLDTIAVSEGTKGIGDDGYNVTVGGAIFSDYSTHPRPHVWIEKNKIFSSAAGRYQVLAHYYDVYKKQLNLKDFGHESQDEIAIQMIKECRAIEDIELGRFTDAIGKCRSRWASLPDSPYGQRTNSIGSLKMAYLKYGGEIA